MIQNRSIDSFCTVSEGSGVEQETHTFVTLEKHAVVMTLTVLASFLYEKEEIPVK